MPRNVIEQLKKAGNLALFHDYRKGHINDLSGNGYNGTFGGNAKMRKTEGGFGVDFDGTNSLVTVGNIGNVKSVMVTLKGRAATDGVLELINNTAFVNLNAGALTSTGFTGPVYYVGGLAGTTVGMDKFYYALVSSDTNIAAASFLVGEANGDYFDGTVESVLAFRALISATEASQIFGELHPWGVP